MNQKSKNKKKPAQKRRLNLKVSNNLGELIQLPAVRKFHFTIMSRYSFIVKKIYKTQLIHIKNNLSWQNTPGPQKLSFNTTHIQNTYKSIYASEKIFFWYRREFAREPQKREILFSKKELRELVPGVTRRIHEKLLLKESEIKTLVSGKSFQHLSRLEKLKLQTTLQQMSSSQREQTEKIISGRYSEKEVKLLHASMSRFFKSSDREVKVSEKEKLLLATLSNFHKFSKQKSQLSVKEKQLLKRELRFFKEREKSNQESSFSEKELRELVPEFTRRIHEKLLLKESEIKRLVSEKSFQRLSRLEKLKLQTTLQQMSSSQREQTEKIISGRYSEKEIKLLHTSLSRFYKSSDREVKVSEKEKQLFATLSNFHKFSKQESQLLAKEKQLLKRELRFLKEREKSNQESYFSEKELRELVPGITRRIHEKLLLKESEIKKLVSEKSFQRLSRLEKLKLQTTLQQMSSSQREQTEKIISGRYSEKEIKLLHTSLSRFYKSSDREVKVSEKEKQLFATLSNFHKFSKQDSRLSVKEKQLLKRELRFLKEREKSNQESYFSEKELRELVPEFTRRIHEKLLLKESEIKKLVSEKSFQRLSRLEKLKLQTTLQQMSSSQREQTEKIISGRYSEKEIKLLHTSLSRFYKSSDREVKVSEKERQLLATLSKFHKPSKQDSRLSVKEKQLLKRELRFLKEREKSNQESYFSEKELRELVPEFTRRIHEKLLLKESEIKKLVSEKSFQRLSRLEKLKLQTTLQQMSSSQREQTEKIISGRYSEKEIKLLHTSLSRFYKSSDREVKVSEKEKQLFATLSNFHKFSKQESQLLAKEKQLLKRELRFLKEREKSNQESYFSEKELRELVPGITRRIHEKLLLKESEVKTLVSEKSFQRLSRLEKLKLHTTLQQMPASRREQTEKIISGHYSEKEIKLLHTSMSRFYKSSDQEVKVSEKERQLLATLSKFHKPSKQESRLLAKEKQLLKRELRFLKERERSNQESHFSEKELSELVPGITRRIHEKLLLKESEIKTLVFEKSFQRLSRLDRFLLQKEPALKNNKTEHPRTPISKHLKILHANKVSSGFSDQRNISKLHSTGLMQNASRLQKTIQRFMQAVQKKVNNIKILNSPGKKVENHTDPLFHFTPEDDVTTLYIKNNKVNPTLLNKETTHKEQVRDLVHKETMPAFRGALSAGFYKKLKKSDKHSVLIEGREPRRLLFDRVVRHQAGNSARQRDDFLSHEKNITPGVFSDPQLIYSEKELSSQKPVNDARTRQDSHSNNNDKSQVVINNTSETHLKKYVAREVEEAFKKMRFNGFENRIYEIFENKLSIEMERRG